MGVLQEGVPPKRVDAYVREQMLRADQDKDGVLSLAEFMLWFHTEVCLHTLMRLMDVAHGNARWTFTSHLSS